MKMAELGCFVMAIIWSFASIISSDHFAITNTMIFIAALFVIGAIKKENKR